MTSNPIDNILGTSAAPLWLPRAAQDARNFAFWAQILFLVIALVYFIWAIVNFVTFWGFFAGIVMLIIAVLCGVSGLNLKKYVVDEIDRGRFNEAKNNMIIWMIIGFVAFVIPGLLLLLAYMKLSEAMAPQTPGYQPYAPGTVVAQQQQQYQTPPYQQQYQQPAQAPAQQPAPAQTYYQPPPAQQPADHKYQMMKCRNCGVQFPAFMTNCPNCGSPK
jgi:hypothetical protein